MRPARAEWIRLMEDGVPRAAVPYEVVARQLAELKRTGVADVLLGGLEPTESPSLPRILRATRDLQLHAILHTHGEALTSASRIGTLRSAGLTCLNIRMRGNSPQPHDAATHRSGSFARACKAVRVASADGLPVFLSAVVAELGPDLQRLAPLAAELGAGLELLGAEPGVTADPRRLRPDEAADVDATWSAAARFGVRLQISGFTWTPEPSTVTRPPPRADVNLLDLVDRGVIPDSASTGVLWDDSLLETGATLSDVAHQLAGSGLPPLDLPPCLGGIAAGDAPRRYDAACASCPRRPICPGTLSAVAAAAAPLPAWTGIQGPAVVIVPKHEDHVAVASTLPALAAALEAEGVTTRLETAWDVTWNPERLYEEPRHSRLERLGSLVYRTLTRRPDPLANYAPPDHLLAHPFRGDDADDRRDQVDDAFHARLDLSGAKCVIVPGFRAARQVLANPTLSADTRVVLVDDHMLEGAWAWAHEVGEGWWPSGRLEVHANFPRFAQLYRSVGVPLRDVFWRRYPLFQGHYAAGVPVLDATWAFAGGRHRRDYGTFAAAIGQRVLKHPFRMHVSRGVDVPDLPALDNRGDVSPQVFLEAVRHSRYVVVPLVPGVEHAAGLTVLAMAHATGRPAITTLSPATLDHVRHDVDGLVVPPSDPEALADAITRLDEDDALVARLAEGAAEAGRALSVAAWARSLARGAPTERVVHAPNADGGTWYGW